VLTLSGLSGLLGLGLMAVGKRVVPADVGDAAVLWYVVLREQLWLLGGLLFLAAAPEAARTTGDQAAAMRRDEQANGAAVRAGGSRSL